MCTRREKHAAFTMGGWEMRREDRGAENASGDSSAPPRTLADDAFVQLGAHEGIVLALEAWR